MLSQPTPKTTISVNATSVIWNGKHCPIIYTTSPGGSSEGLTFFDEAHAGEAKQILEEGKALDATYEIQPIKGNLFGSAAKESFDADFASMFLMKVAKVNNRIIGFIDVPKIWLLREDKINLQSLSSKEFTDIIKPDIAELEAQIPKIVIKPKVPPTSLLKSDEDDEDEVKPEVTDTKPSKKGK